jgi:DNA polymerase V
MTINSSMSLSPGPANTFKTISDEPCRLVGHFLSKKIQELPLLYSRKRADLLASIEDNLEEQIDLQKFFNNHPADTFIVRAAGDSMMNYIHPNDLLIADRTITPIIGHIVIVTINGKLAVKYLKNTQGKVMLMPANPVYKPIEISVNADICIWGVVCRRITCYAFDD